jgi:hypothetical protein
MRSKLLILLAAAAVAATAAAPADAFWNGLNEGRRGVTGAEAGSLGQGAAPTLNKLSSSSVMVRWAGTTLSTGQTARAYLVNRVNQQSGVSTPALNGCDGPVSSGLTCTETGVPTGQWRYTVTPLFGANWKGAQSAPSAPATSEPGTLTLSSILVGGTAKPLPATLTGTLAGFGPSEGIERYVLDAGTPLTGTPLAVGPAGTVTITSLVIPTGVSDGVHTVRVVGRSGSEASLDVTVDNSAPSGGSVDAKNLAGTGARYSTQTALSLNLSRGSDPGAGLAGGHQLLRATAALNSDGTGDGICASFGTPTQVGALNPGTTVNDTVPADKSCYRYQYVVPDALGNKVTYASPEVKVDTTPPSAAALNFPAATNAFWPGAGTVVFYRPSATSGSFKMTASASDLGSGIAGFTFPSLGSGWTTTSEGPNAATFSWNAINPAVPGVKSVGATNNAGGSTNSGFTPTADNAGPVNASVDYTGGTISTTNVAVVFAKGNDPGAGVELASGLLQRSVATLNGANCGTFSAFATIQANPSSPFNDNTVEDAKCYQYRYLISDNVGNQVIFSNAKVLKVQVPPANTSAPSIGGSAQEGSQLTANDGTWSGTGNVFSYQWRRCNSTGAACVDIAGATAKSYTAVLADVAGTLRVVVTATNPAGPVSATSAPTAAVLNAKPLNTVSPEISGSPQVGQPLIVSEGSWTGGNLGFSFKWLRCASGGACVDIGISPTLREYVVQQVDVGSTIRVDVTASNSGGSTTTRTAPTAEAGAKAPFNQTLPVISGPVREGQALNTTNGTWTNTGGTLNFSYQWRQCNLAGASCVDVGTNAATYVLRSADVEHRMRVIVTAQDSQGTTKAESVQSAPILFAAPVNTVAPTLSGEPEVTKTLTATTGTWTGGGVSFSFRWQRCQGNGANCNNIAGSQAENSAYELVEADAERALRVVVTATNSGGSVKKESATTQQINRVAPVNVTAPVVSGTAQQGQVLSTTDGIWNGSGISFKYHWLRCTAAGTSCAVIPGAAAEKATYLATVTDVGSRLRSEVTATNFGHSVTAPLSSPSAVVTVPAPANTVAPTVSGVPRQGVGVTAGNGAWLGSPTFAHQWQRCETTVCTDIPGATAQIYTPVAADVGKTLVVVVTATNGGGSTAATSNPSAVVVPPAPVNSALPTIAGTLKVGQVLTAADGTWSGSPTFTYQWRRCDGNGQNCTAIVGATAKVYTLVGGELGDANRKMRVDVTAANAGGSGVASSAVSGTVAP